MSKPRKHHYLSQFYLRGFSQDGKGLNQIEKASGKHVGVQIRDAAAIRDYHILDYDDAEDPQAFEKALADYEGVMAAALARVLSRGIHSEDDHDELLRLVSLMRFRVPAFKSFIDKSLQDLVRSAGEIAERSNQLPELPEELKGLLSFTNGTIAVAVSNWACLQHMFRLATDNDLLQIMKRMSVELVVAPKGLHFLTCDQPVAMFSAAAHRGDQYGVGMDHPSAELTMPLSSAMLLRLSWGRPHDSRMATELEVSEFNRRTIIMADARLFAIEASRDLMGLVDRNRHHFAGMSSAMLAGCDGAFLHISKLKPVMRPEEYAACG